MRRSCGHVTERAQVVQGVHVSAQSFWVVNKSTPWKQDLVKWTHYKAELNVRVIFVWERTMNWPKYQYSAIPEQSLQAILIRHVPGNIRWNQLCLNVSFFLLVKVFIHENPLLSNWAFVSWSYACTRLHWHRQAVWVRLALTECNSRSKTLSSFGSSTKWRGVAPGRQCRSRFDTNRQNIVHGLTNITRMSCPMGCFLGWGGGTK